MTEKDIRQDIDRLIGNETDRLEALIRRIERLLYDESVAILDEFDYIIVNNTPTIANNPKNMRLATVKAGNRLKGKYEAVKRNIIQKVYDIAKKVIRSLILLKTAQGTPLSEAQQKSAEEIVFLRYGFNARTGKLIKGGYLEAITDIQPVITQTAGDMIKAIQSGEGVINFKRRFAQQFMSGVQQGYLTRYFNRWTNDIFQQVDAVTQLQLATELGQNYGIYAGTIKDNTRCFCKERINHIYTKEEMVSWNNLSWKGKIKGGNVLIDRGGYNCRHTINWVSDEIAERIIENQQLNTYEVC
jgi:hypothetical protein